MIRQEIAAQVVEMLAPGKLATMYGDDYDTITWRDGATAPITKEQYEAGFAQYEILKAKQKADALKAKAAAQAKLEALGLTVQDLGALGLS
jgi:hypothetical protein